MFLTLFRLQVGSEFDDSLHRLVERSHNCNLDFMDEYIYISSSDDDDFDLEEIDDPRRTLPQWATTERNSGW